MAVAPDHDPPGGGRVVVRRTALGMAVQRGEPAVGVERHVVAHLAPEQVVDGASHRLALDVPQRDVDPADDGRRQTPGTEVRRLAKEPVPHRRDVGCVLADDPGAEVPEGVGDHEAAVAGEVRCLAPAVHALVGQDVHEGPDVLRLRVVVGAPPGGVDDEDLEVGDPHDRGRRQWDGGRPATGDRKVARLSPGDSRDRPCADRVRRRRGS